MLKQGGQKVKKKNQSKEKPEKKPFFHSETATSTVIGVVLLLGIIFSVFAIIRIGYVPEWKNDAEYSNQQAKTERFLAK